MKKPTSVDFIIRVGGLAVIYIIVIKLIRALFPGYESIAVYLITASVLILGVLDSLRRKKTSDKRNIRKRKKAG